MREPCDFVSDLKALADKAKQLTRKRWSVRCSLSPKPPMPCEWRAGASAVPPSFKARRASVALEQNANRTALPRSTAARHRLEARKARADMREWQFKQRERTQQLIELGGLVVKAGLVELVDDDRATHSGASLTVAAKLRGEDGEQAIVLWKRKGKWKFEIKS